MTSAKKENKNQNRENTQNTGMSKGEMPSGRTREGQSSDTSGYQGSQSQGQGHGKQKSRDKAS